MKTTLYFLTLLCVVLTQTSCDTHKQVSTLHDKTDKSDVFFEPEQSPCYIHGGNEGLLNDLYTTIFKTAPATKECVKGRAVVNFNISRDGQIDTNSIKVIRNMSVPDDYLNAAIEAIKKLDKFEPGKMNGTPVRVTYTISIIYPVPLDKINTVE